MDPVKLMKKGWSSSLGSAPAYQYQALPQASKMFRLLDLSPSRDPKEPLRGAIRTVNVDFIEHAQTGPDWKGPRWTALSYVWGGALPFILRQTDIDDDRPYHIVGGATYVHGIMFGEALKIAEQEKIPEQEFWIA
jgi:hypothetical protein